MVFQNKFKALQLVLDAARSEFDDYCSIIDPGLPITSMRAHIRWTLPGPGRFKLNWDPSVDKMSMRIEIGIIIRDERGHVLAYLSLSYFFSSQPIVSKRQTLLRALDF